MKKSRVIFVLMFGLLWTSLTLNAQSEKFKALFLYNFIKHVEWPTGYNQGDLIIGILGNNPVKSELEAITMSQRVGTQSIKVKVFSSVDEVTDCHVIYISPGKTNQISQLSSKIKREGTLIVSDNRGGISLGAGINFIISDDKLKYEISKNHIEQQGMKVSSNLLKMGIEV